MVMFTFFVLDQKKHFLGKSGPKNQNCQFKFYLRYKTITSQNVSSEAQIKNFFIS